MNDLPNDISFEILNYYLEYDLRNIGIFKLICKTSNQFFNEDMYKLLYHNFYNKTNNINFFGTIKINYSQTKKLSPKEKIVWAIKSNFPQFIINCLNSYPIEN